MNEANSRDQIDLLAEEYVRRHRSGSPVSIEDFAKLNPDHADDIRELFPLLVNLEQLRAASSPASTASFMVPAVSKLGDFTIVREVGRGGMGIIFEAIQESLGRRVALKVMFDSGVGDSNQVSRFRREAESASRLHHTHIVPIYGIGQDGPWHYFAMQFIDGLSMDKVIKLLGDRLAVDDTRKAGIPAMEQLNRSKFPTSAVEIPPVAKIIEKLLAPHNRLDTPAYREKIVSLMADVAEAVAHAHQQGVLHRDLKPGNLLIDPTLQIRITDFGLAKPDTHESLTRPGDVMGTLRYMAPEQFRGQSDVRSDIYSLGITLFELLTLRPVFDNSRNGAIANTSAGIAAPRLRKIDPTFTRDLDTIVAKAADVDPRHRYQTAQDLALDLRSYLLGRPIRARRASSFEHAWRWCRRNPLTAMLGLLVALSMVTATVLSTWSNHRTNVALSRLFEANQREQESRFRAEDNLNLAIDGFDEILEGIINRGNPQAIPISASDQDIPKVVHEISQEDIDLLNRLLAFYGRFTMRNQSDPVVAVRNAAAHHRIGKIQQRLGNFEAADESFQQALKIYTEHLERVPEDISGIVSKAGLMNDIGLAMTEAQKPLTEVVAQHQSVIQLLTNLSVKNSDDPGVRYQLARAYDLSGSARFRGRIASFSVRAAGSNPQRPGLAASVQDRGGKSYAENPRQFHREMLQSARKVIEQLADDFPAEPRFRLLNAQTERHWLAFTQINFESSDATKIFQSARQTLEDLVRDFPSETLYLAELAETLTMLNTRRTSLTLEETTECLTKAIDCSRTLCEQSPNIVSYRALHATTEIKLARFLRQRGALEPAQAHFEAAIEQVRRLCEEHPGQLSYVTSLLVCTLELSELLRERAEADSDPSFVRLAKERVESALKEFAGEEKTSEDRAHLQVVVSLYHSLARALRKLGDESAAAVTNAMANRLARELPVINPAESETKRAH
jgi:serine/threonine protein kinase